MDYDIQRKKCDDLERMCHNAKEIYNKLCTEFDQSHTAESYLINGIVPWIGSCWDATPPQIGLLGVGMGGQGGLRLGFKYPDTFPLIAAITPSVDHQQCCSEVFGR